MGRSRGRLGKLRMKLQRHPARSVVPWVAGLASIACASVAAHAQGATRDLSAFSAPGTAFTVTIALDPPPDTVAAGVQDKPPAGWIVTNISAGGTWDALNQEVKWGPLLAPSIPAFVAYDVTPPAGTVGRLCFAGIVSFGGPAETVAGDECLAVAVPAVSTWGLMVLSLLLVTAGTLIASSRAARC